MLKSLRFSSLYVFAASAGLLACTPAGTTTTVIDSGTTTGSGGATGSGGSTSGSGGSSASGGSTVSGSGGSTSGSGGSTSGSGGSGEGSGGAGETGGAIGTASGGSMGSGGRGGAGSGSGGAPGSGGAAGSTAAGGAGGDNKIVLFDGSVASFNNWAPVSNPNGANPWTRNADGTMTVGNGDIISKMKFQSLFVHVEYMTPVVQATDTGATGQNRGNSGVYLKGAYEMQVLDTYGMPIADDGCGAVYKVKAPLVSACFQGGMWNTYEIEFKANSCNPTVAAKIVSATLNGKVVQENVDVPATTVGGQPVSCNPAGLLLQSHGSFKPVIFRNVWVIPRN